ncbi:MAG: hypothetical protein ACXWJN_09215 [Methyloceanibacter sp.]
MPQLLILLGAGIGIFVVRRLYRSERQRVATELDRAREAMRHDEEAAIPLERDPMTGIYRPKAMR